MNYNAQRLKLALAFCSELLQTTVTYRSNKWEDETSPNASTNISDWQNESSGYTLLVRHVGQGQVSLGHADG